MKCGGERVKMAMTTWAVMSIMRFLPAMDRSVALSRERQRENRKASASKKDLGCRMQSIFAGRSSWDYHETWD